VLSVPELFELADKVEDQSDPDTELSQLHHALQTAEAAKSQFPAEKYDWLHLTAFLHDLGKGPMLEPPNTAVEALPMWSVVGDTFPLGCPFSDKCLYPDLFANNPDTKVSRFQATPTGIYAAGCGFDALVMSYGHDEYFASVLQNNSRVCTLPPEALYIVRYHSFYPWHQHQAYSELASDFDRKNLHWLQTFQKLDLYSKVPEPVIPDKLLPYYQKLMDKYFGSRNVKLQL
jgi:inositol oxygenase